MGELIRFPVERRQEKPSGVRAELVVETGWIAIRLRPSVGEVTQQPGVPVFDWKLHPGSWPT